MIEDEPPLTKKQPSLEAQLENASIGDLEARIALLQREIQLCEHAIQAKRAQRAAADSVFGAPPNT